MPDQPAQSGGLHRREALEGIVVRAKAGHYTVHTPEGEIECRMRGRLKHVRQGRLQTNPIAVGDRVRIVLLPSGQPPGRACPAPPGVKTRLARSGDRPEQLFSRQGVVEEVLSRGRVFSRQARGHPPREQVILANADQVVLVFAVKEPSPNPRLIDRFLATAEAAELPAILCFNKIDLLDEDDLPESLRVYQQIGYRVLRSSAVTGEGLDELKAVLADKISVLSGPSGAGKSSLINAIQPGLKRKVGDISEWSGKGTHTTRETVLLPLDVGGYIADTAGIRQLVPWDPEFDLDWCYREFRPYLNECHYADCFHTHEPGCAVRTAVQRGQISEARYDSYRRFYEQVDDH